MQHDHMVIVIRDKYTLVEMEGGGWGGVGCVMIAHGVECDGDVTKMIIFLF